MRLEELLVLVDRFVDRHRALPAPIHPDTVRDRGLDEIPFDLADAPEMREAAVARLLARCAEMPVPLVTEADFARAGELCRQTGQALQADAGVDAIVQTWPAPIAHELHALIEALCGTYDGGKARPPSPEAALLQLRDLTEILLRLPGTALVAALAATDPEEAAWCRRQMAKVSGGAWKRLCGKAASRLLARAPGHPLAGLAGLFAGGKPFDQMLDALIQARNDYLGHSGVRPDPEETAGIVRWYVAGGDERPKNEPTIRRPAATLLEGLRWAAREDPWRGWTLEMQVDGAPVALTGAAALRGWFRHPSRHRHVGETLPVHLVSDGAPPLLLSPWVTGRQCQRCAARDVFVFDVLYDRNRFDLQDYGRGHKTRVRRRDDPDLDRSLPAADLPAAPDAPPEFGDDALDSARVLAQLDRLRVDRRYLSPAYLRQDLADFVAGEAAGIYWLQAPAHVGKTSFAQGLALAELKEGELARGLRPAEGPEGLGGGVAAFFCRKEYREGGGLGFLNAIGHALRRALDIPEDHRARLPAAAQVADAADPRAAFAAWLGEWRGLARDPDAALLLVVDGLDEADPPGPAGSLFDYLPRPASLPPGVFLLLTSRRPGDPDCPAWLANALAPALPADAGAGFRRRRIGKEDADYVALLRAYAAKELGRGQDDADFREAFPAILAAADGLFVHVALLVAQLRAGRIAPADIPRMGIGEVLHERFLDDLEAAHPAKLADEMGEILATLAAAELAHDWLFEAGALPDPALAPPERARAWVAAAVAGDPWPAMPGVPVLEPAEREWHGLDLEVLARAVQLDAPARAGGRRRYLARFVYLLTALQGVLGVWRGEAGAARYRIGLKGLGGRVRSRDPARVTRACLRLADRTAEALEALRGEAAGEASPAETADARAAAAALLSLLPGCLATGASDPMLERLRRLEPQRLALAGASEAYEGFRFREATLSCNLAMVLHARLPTQYPARGTLAVFLAAAYNNRGNARQGQQDLAAAVADYGQAIEIREALRAALGDRWPAAFANDLAAAYSNRGNARQGQQDLAAAVADYGQAIEIGEALRRALGDQWPAAFANDLATAYSNRGNARQGQQELAAAVADHGQAIEIREALRRALGDQWPAAFANDLAGTYTNRGNARQGQQDLAAAVADYGQAIEIREALRRTFGDQWPAAFANALAGTYTNRGNARQGQQELAAAVADYGQAIEIGEALRRTFGDQWPAAFANDLAAAYSNRGNAREGQQDLAAAVADYGQAIEIGEALRRTFGDQWPAAFANDLAMAYMNRGIARAGQQDLAAAVADYGQAIEIREALRRALGDQWPAAFANDLATAYSNRGNARQGQQELAAAVADHGQAIEIREALRRALGDQWPAAFANDLAGTYTNRGNARQGQQDLAAAVADYGQAIEIREALRRTFGDQWPAAFANDLAGTYTNRGNARQGQQDLAAAVADYGQAIEIGEALRRTFGDQWPAAFANDLAAAYSNRGNARVGQQELAAAVADYGQAIEIGEALRRALGDQWPAAFANDLAGTYTNRGNARQGQQDLAAAVADYGQAIEIREALRRTFGDQWPAAFANDLAAAYSNRGNARQGQQELAAAVADYGQAIEIGEALRRALGDQWPAAFAQRLLADYRGRAAALAALGRDAEAAGDRAAARQIQAALLPDWLIPAPGWTPAEALQGGKDWSAAVVAYATERFGTWPSVVGAQVRPLACVPGGVLVALQSGAPDGGERVARLLGLPGTLLFLRGISAPMHGLASSGALALDDVALAADYLRLFFDNVTGEDGIFRIVERPADLPWRAGVPAGQRSAVEALVIPLDVQARQAGGFAARGTVLYGTSLFRVDFALDGGQVAMTDDEMLAEDLPVRRTVIRNGWRYETD